MHLWLNQIRKSLKDKKEEGRYNTIFYSRSDFSLLGSDVIFYVIPNFEKIFKGSLSPKPKIKSSEPKRTSLKLYLLVKMYTFTFVAITDSNKGFLIHNWDFPKTKNNFNTFNNISVLLLYLTRLNSDTMRTNKKLIKNNWLMNNLVFSILLLPYTVGSKHYL